MKIFRRVSLREFHKIDEKVEGERKIMRNINDVFYSVKSYNKDIDDDIIYYYDIPKRPHFRIIRYGVYYQRKEKQSTFLALCFGILIIIFTFPIVLAILLLIHLFEYSMEINIVILVPMLLTIPEAILARFIILPKLMDFKWFRSIMDIFLTEGIIEELEREKNNKMGKRRAYRR